MAASLSCLPSKDCAAVLPNKTMTFGCSKATCRSNQGRQASISAGSGVRLSGGRHFTALAIYTAFCRVRSSAASMASSNCPAAPTNGSPCASSSLPGPSPMNSHSALTSPTPGTACRRRWPSTQARQACIAGPSSSQASSAGSGADFSGATMAGGQSATTASASAAVAVADASSPGTGKASRRVHRGRMPISISICSRLSVMRVLSETPGHPHAPRSQGSSPCAHQSAENRSYGTALRPEHCWAALRATGVAPHAS